MHQCLCFILKQISMLSEKLLNDLHLVCMHIRQRNTSFGGIQTICVGDFHQLPPVPSVRYSDPGSFAFNSEVWAKTFHTVIMEGNHRQKDSNFIKVSKRKTHGSIIILLIKFKIQIVTIYKSKFHFVHQIYHGII